MIVVFADQMIPDALQGFAVDFQGGLELLPFRLQPRQRDPVIVRTSSGLRAQVLARPQCLAVFCEALYTLHTYPLPFHARAGEPRVRSGPGRRRSRWEARAQGCGKIGRTPDDRAAGRWVASRQIFQKRRVGMSHRRVAGLALVLSGLVLGWSLAGPGVPSQETHGRRARALFMDLLMGGARAAEAAARVASALPETSEAPLQAQVFTRNGRTVREYTLVIQEKVFDYGGGTRWRAWTFNGTVPGPTLRVRKGEILRVRVVNWHNRVHSFHAHLSRYPLEMDGSQANVITGRAPGAMIPPGGEYVYEVLAEEAGATYYHCHSADREFAINQHILQGLYGAILVDDPAMKPMREGVVFMAETGQLRSGPNPPFSIMNGKGIPGGELAAGMIGVFVVEP